MEDALSGKREGGCLCGNVRYSFSGAPLQVALCHCTHCQRQSGSVFSVNLLLSEQAYRQSGETTVFEDKGDSGQPVYREFCGRCGSPILSRLAAAPGVVIIKAGTLDDRSGLAPTTEVYAVHAAAWLAPLPGVARFAQMPG